MLRRLIDNQKGGVLVLFALAIVTLCAFAGLVVDVGNFYVQHARLQNAVDAASMAGALKLPLSAADASTAAQTYMQNNTTMADNYDPTKLQVTYPATNQISVAYTGTVPTYFLQLINIYTTDIKVSAVSQVQTVTTAANDPVFGYTIFSGSSASQLNMNGSKWNIGGSVHSNQNLNINGSFINVTGAAESVGTTTVSASHSNTIGSQTSGANSLTMPDYYSQIKSEAATAKTTSTNWANGTNVNVNGNVYVNGTSTFNGNTYSGTGAILAESNITFNGNNINASSSGQVCFYSESGNITINGSGYTIDGILYAPHGMIVINGTNVTVNGRIIANTVAMNGSNITVDGTDNPVTSLPQTGGTTTYHAQLIQ